MPKSADGMYIPTERLAVFAANTARESFPRGRTCGAAAARRTERALGRVRRARDAAENAHSPAAEWLLDNWYLIEREGLGAAEEFAAARRLRAVSGGGTVIGFGAAALVRSGLGEVTAERMGAFLEGFQRAMPLERAELTLFAAAVRAELVAYIAARPEDVQVVSSAVTSLRTLSTLDLSAVIEGADLTDAILRRDPAGIYPGMDERTRGMYLAEITRLARKRRTSEQKIAQTLLSLAEGAGPGEARHVGWWLLEKPLGGENARGGAAAYAAANAALTVAVSAAAGALTRSVWSAVLSLLPASELVKGLMDAAVLRFSRPRLIPRMDLPGGVPEEGLTVCAVSALLTGEGSGREIAGKIEEYRHASRECGKNLLFALLADLPEARERDMPEDAARIAAAKAAFDELNEKYSGGFYLLCRPRVYSERDGRYMPRERKRGAIMALAALTQGLESELTVVSGDAAPLRRVKYILALDSDTRLLPGAASELIGAMLHPLNRPQVEGGMVVRGRGVIHPRMDTELESAVKTRFSRIFAPEGGTDPYSSACGEVWMDLAGRGGFSGKGIIDAAARIECCSGLPDGVLSHDAIEGALLRGGYMSDTALMDSFPSAPLPYFKRLHRWTRGDWQNIRFMAPNSGLPWAERLKLFDSLRRSLVPLGMTASVFFAAALPSAGTLAAAGVSAAALLSHVPRSAAYALVARREGRGESLSCRGVGGELKRAAARAMLLPTEAAVCTGAAVTALWRTFVSKRNLLQWQTAAQGESASGTLGAYLRAMWPQCLLGAASAGAAIFVPSAAACALWLAGPALGKYLSGGQLRPERLSGEDREYLLGEVKRMWGYFSTFCCAEYGYLPPDNFQEQPPVGAAARTSPTNIGLALVSALAAADLGAEEKARSFALIENVLDTAEGLPKWRGHLFNWYDIKKLAPLEPKYVSTVDSGNLAACLTALAAGLREYGREDLAVRAEELAAGMDFEALYDKRRRLFRIGYDVDKGLLSEGLYDLMSSEARLTGFYAVARGIVGRRHWRALSRAMVSCAGRRGMASWTGTMFEYLMPELFLPLKTGGALWESARFCLFAQRRDVDPGQPWGESESAFYSLDGALSYRYKAHGCTALALKRGMGADTVTAPYASYLALCVSPEEAVKNLRRFESFGAEGRFGPYEAVDFTPSRCPEGGKVVRCVMAHHLGMSITAAANCLLGNIMVKRFMSSPEMRAFEPLLAEKTSPRAVTLRPGRDEPPAKPGRGEDTVYEIRGAAADAARPGICLLSNGVYSIMLTETGLSLAVSGGAGVYLGVENPLTGPAGMTVKLAARGASTNLLPQPGAEGGLKFEHIFTGSCAAFEGRGEDFESRVAVSVAAAAPAGLWEVNLRGAAPEGELVFEFVPVLARISNYVNHPAFYRLGMRAEASGTALFITRLPRGETGPLCLCVLSDAECSCRANEDGEPLGWLNRARVTLRAPVSPGADGAWNMRLAIAVGEDRESALASARAALDMRPEDFADIPGELAEHGGFSGRDIERAMELGAAIAFPRSRSELAPAPEGLWKYGISGDLPVVCAHLNSLAQREAARSLIRRHALLRACGLLSDLVFITGDGGNYMRPLSRAVAELLAECGLEGLAAAKGGVHTAELPALEVERAAAAEAVLAEGSEVRLGPPCAAVKAAGPEAYPPLPRRRAGKTAMPECEWLPDGSFAFSTRGKLPPRCWTHMLSNGSFGYLAADSGLGCMWHENARMRRINDWVNDDLAISGPETLEMEHNGRRVSLFADADGIDCRVTCAFGFARWEKCGAAVTAFVPPETDARILMIERAGGPVYWKTSLTLAENSRGARYVTARFENGRFAASSPLWDGGGVSAAFSRQPERWTCDEAAWLAGRAEGESGPGLLPCFAAAFPPGELVIAFSTDPALAAELSDPARARAELERTAERWKSTLSRLHVKTPDEELDRFLNGWAAYQALSCRLMGRTSLYQSGGAYGFRDQLQDAVNMILIDPSIARGRILDCCRRQYEAGDVMHWWHPEGGSARGVRTRCSDDYLWLPWAAAEYVSKTGNRAILDETAPFLRSEPLAAHEHSRYERPESTAEKYTVLEHCRRALALYKTRGSGAHGLPLILDGDWNDGFDAVGRGGRGESVWLAWFYAHTARAFSELLPDEEATELRAGAAEAAKAAMAAWDGEWYLRGWYDDGKPLGSRGSRGCKIDAIAQAWAAMDPDVPPERKNAALDAAISELFDEKTPLLKLFTPPFGPDGDRAGYINSYGPGFRENGGQYTHGALWLALACLKNGRTEDGLRLLHAAVPRADVRYGAEPYAVPADVSAAPERYGEAGWTWYTGSAGWLFRTAAEELLGLRLEGGEIRFEPNVPQSWDGFEAVWTDGGGQEHRYQFTNNLPTGEEN